MINVRVIITSGGYFEMHGISSDNIQNLSSDIWEVLLPYKDKKSISVDVTGSPLVIEQLKNNNNWIDHINDVSVDKTYTVVKNGLMTLSFNMDDHVYRNIHQNILKMKNDFYLKKAKSPIPKNTKPITGLKLVGKAKC